MLKYPSEFQFIPTDLWNCTIVSTDNSSHTVYLKGVVKDNAQNVLLNITSNSFTVPAGGGNYTSATITTNKIDYFNTDIRNAIQQSGQFPASSYVSCLYIYDASTNTELNNTCVENTVEIINPPTLVFPNNQDVLDNAYPVFTWLPPSPLRSGQKVNYELKVVQLQDGQTPTDGIMRNPEYFDQKDINQELLAYPFSALPFQMNKSYAWQVTAVIDNFPIGKTEVWAFSLKPKDADSAINPLQDHNYILLKNDVEGGYYIANGGIKFRLPDEYHTGIKSYRFSTPDNKEVSSNGLQISQPGNGDHYIFDLQSVQDIEDNKFYLFELSTNAGAHYVLRFKYKHPQGQNQY